MEYWKRLFQELFHYPTLQYSNTPFIKYGAINAMKGEPYE